MIDSDIGPARDAGLDVGEYERFLAAAATLGARLLTPGQAGDMIARAGQEDGSLRHATAAKVAEKAALAAAAAAAAALSEAKQTATGDLQRAQQYLAQAEATKLLDVAADASALQKLGTQLTAAVTLPDFQAADEAIRPVAERLGFLLYIRNSTSQLLEWAQGSLQRCQAINLNVDGDQQALS